MRRFFRQCMLAIAIGSILLTGCTKKTEDVPAGIRQEKGYSLPEIMIVAATEKNRYEQVYTEQIWQVTLGEEGISFEDYIRNQVDTFMDELKIMNHLANDKEITLTSSEKEQIKQLSDAYFDGLTEDDVNYMKITREDVTSLYEEYHLANKLVNELTKDVDLEVSDSEAKVISIQQIKTQDRETADTAWNEVSLQSIPFETAVKNYSMDQELKHQVGRGDLPPALEEAAFSLETGEMSGVIEADGSFYVLKSVSAYEEAATEERKKKLSSERKNEAFQQIYDQFLSQNPIVFQHETWSGIAFSDADKSTAANFFELYKEYFPG